MWVEGSAQPNTETKLAVNHGFFIRIDISTDHNTKLCSRQEGAKWIDKKLRRRNIYRR